MSDQQQPALEQVEKSISLIPVGLKEAALDSPTFRATAVHFSDQVELIERWLEGYIRSASKLAHESTALESLINTFLTNAVPPTILSEAVLDHDYTFLALQRYGEGARDFWSSNLAGIKRMEATLVEPLRAFLNVDVRNFKDVRRSLEQSQKQFDNLLSRYSAQTKSKEPSSIREDAFQLHEARRSYLKASMDFSILAPQLRSSLDKVLVKVFSEQWKGMRTSRENTTVTLGKWAHEMDRVRGWSREMEFGEKTFKRELQTARKQIEESAETATRPTRELDDYAISTVPYLGSKSPSTAPLQSPVKPVQERPEKQGWLFQRTLVGKPTRTVWVRRWFFVKNGIFGWLVQGIRSGGVEESDRTGVLLCSIRPAFQEERRFCFEVLTKNHGILLQAETQTELMEWIAAFEAAKRKALEDPASTDTPIIKGPGYKDPASAISPPSAPEFAIYAGETHAHHGSDESSALAFDRSSTLPVLDPGGAVSLASRSTFDVSSPRRSTFSDRDGESGRDHAARIIQKLDLHRKSNAQSQTSGSASAGGIASLISASHTVLPVGPVTSRTTIGADGVAAKAGQSGVIRDLAHSTLAPSTLANPPAPTNLSKTAVIVSSERGNDVGGAGADGLGGMPSGMMANLWGSTNWGHINRAERGEIKNPQGTQVSNPPSPMARPSGSPPITDDGSLKLKSLEDVSREESIYNSAKTSRPTSPTRTSRALSTTNTELAPVQRAAPNTESLPYNYPLPLKTQDAQFRMLFPSVRRDERLVLVFRATWNPNEQQEFPGRVYVTDKELYFYSHHFGLILVSGRSLATITEVTAAPGRDCDYLYMQLKEDSSRSTFNRLTIKIFLEPLRLLQRRLNFLVQNCHSENPLGLEAIMTALMRMENEDPPDSPSLESWEDVSLNTPMDDGSGPGRSASQRQGKNLKASLRIDQGLHGPPSMFNESKDVTKFRLPAKPVDYAPQGMERLAVEKFFEISPKALFHVMFGDKSAVFQILYHQRNAQLAKQQAWTKGDQGHLKRDFDYQVNTMGMFRQSRHKHVVDHQTIDILNDHLCYVVTDRKTPWHLPHEESFLLLSKIVITHVAKSKCKMAIYTKVDWTRTSNFAKGVIQKQALEDLDQDALDLTEAVTDQVQRLGARSRTKKAIQIFGQVGQQNHDSQLPVGGSASLPMTSRRRPIRQRSFVHLLLETIGSFAESALSSVMMSIFAVVKRFWKIINANYLILALLALSVVTNMFYSARETSDWWKDRRTGQFMARLGVVPNPIMSKAIYLKDMDNALESHSSLLQKPADDNKCYSKFREIASLADINAPYNVAASTYSDLSTKTTARRLRRTRQQLGSQRHDLLVAMRVIDSVEREVVRAEWENWLLDENLRCAQLDRLISRNRTAVAEKMSRGRDENVAPLDKERRERLEGVRKWVEEYCASCRMEREAVFLE